MVFLSALTAITARKGTTNVVSSNVGKVEQIQQVLSEPEVDLWKLRELALSEGGLVNDTIRRRAWPKLIGLITHCESNHSLRSNSVGDLFAPNSLVSVVSTYPQRRSSSQFSMDDDHLSTRAVSGQEIDDAISDGSSNAAEDVDAPPPADASAPAQSNPQVRRYSQLAAFIRNSPQFHNLHRDDVSISSNTTSSVANMGSGRRSYNLPLLATSLDFRQIELDAKRSTWHLLTGDQRIQRLQMEHKSDRRVARLISRKQRRLVNLLNYTLVKSYSQTSPDKLRYYQGYHDVACIFMSALGGCTALQPPSVNVPQDMQAMAAAMGLDLPSRVLAKVSLTHLRDFLKPDFKDLQTALELTLFPMIAKLDMAVHDCLRQADMQPFFALSWVITWFSHEVRDTELAKRIFDLFLVSHPLMPIYLAIAMVLHPTNREIILTVERDFGTIHQTLRNLTKNSSMTGWKYRPGDGYVSDDGEEQEADEEEEEVQADSIEQAGIAGDFEKIRSELVTEDPNGTAMSSVSTWVENLAEGQARVPFQELIDMALDFMRLLPPRKLLPLAVRYYGGPHVAALIANSPDISLFADPPNWAVRSRATADWVYHQRALVARKRSNVEMSNYFSAEEEEDEEEERWKSVLLLRRKSLAVIALGFGEGDNRLRKKKKRRRAIIIGAVGVALVAIVAGVVWKMYSSSKESPSSDPSKDVCILDDFTKDVCTPRVADKESASRKLEFPVLRLNQRPRRPLNRFPERSEVKMHSKLGPRGETYGGHFEGNVLGAQGPRGESSGGKTDLPFMAFQGSGFMSADSAKMQFVGTNRDDEPRKPDGGLAVPFTKVRFNLFPSKTLVRRIGKKTSNTFVKFVRAGRTFLARADLGRKRAVGQLESSMVSLNAVVHQMTKKTSSKFLQVASAGQRMLKSADLRRKRALNQVQLALDRIPDHDRNIEEYLARKVAQYTLKTGLAVASIGREFVEMLVSDPAENIEEEFGRNVIEHTQKAGRMVVSAGRALVGRTMGENPEELLQVFARIVHGKWQNGLVGPTTTKVLSESNKKGVLKALSAAVEFLDRPLAEGLDTVLGWLNEPLDLWSSSQSSDQ